MKYIRAQKRKSEYPVWFNKILILMEDAYKDDLTLLIDKVKSDGKNVFIVENKKSKIKAFFRKDKSKIHIDISEVGKEIPEGEILPSRINIFKGELDTKSFEYGYLITKLLETICLKNDFYRNAYNKIPVYQVSSFTEDRRFSGGEIVDKLHCSESFENLILQDGFVFKLKNNKDQVIRIKDFIVFDKYMNYEIMHESVFRDFYVLQ